MTTFKKFSYIKKIHSIPPNEDEKKGAECDVALITTDNRLILIEVTMQKDLDNITNILGQKVKNLEEKRIPYDALGFVTASHSSEKFLTYDSKKKIKIFFANHLQRIDKFVDKELIE